MNRSLPDVVESYDFEQFDVGTKILLMTDGSFRVSLSCMPPDWCDDPERIDSFEEALAEFTGLPAEAMDKEYFSLSSAGHEPTIALTMIQRGLLALRAHYEDPASESQLMVEFG